MEEISEKVIYTDGYPNYMFSCLENLLLRSPEEKSVEEYWHEGYYTECLVKNLSHSVYYRKILKENSVEDVLDIWMKDAPSLKLLISRYALSAAIKNMKENMGNATIIRLPRDAEFTVKGHVYRGVNDLKRQANIPDSSVIDRSHLFPCFDSSDYMYENRYFHNFWFCKQDPEMSEQITLLRDQGGHCFLNENLPQEALPMVYYADEEKTLLFGYNEN